MLQLRFFEGSDVWLKLPPSSNAMLPSSRLTRYRCWLYRFSPGSRPLKGTSGVHVACAVIVKYRDEKTDRATALEDALR